jgi:hypothetical protein
MFQNGLARNLKELLGQSVTNAAASAPSKDYGDGFEHDFRFFTIKNTMQS